MVYYCIDDYDEKVNLFIFGFFNVYFVYFNDIWIEVDYVVLFYYYLNIVLIC